MVLLLSILFGVPVVSAAEDPVPTPAERDAEYRRLRDDLGKFAEKEMWSAVERNYLRCLNLFPDPETTRSEAWAPPTAMLQSDHMFAAQAAMNRGDLYEVRRRVVRAVRKEQTGKALDWLWAIDTTYSEVQITADVGTELVVVRRPFDPRILKAIHHAATTLRETGTFHGLLPRLPFDVGEVRMVVEGGKGLVVLDLTDGTQKKIKKSRRKKKLRTDR